MNVRTQIMGFDPSHRAERENDFMEVLKEYTPISVKNSSIKFTFTSILAYDLLEYN